MESGVGKGHREEVVWMDLNPGPPTTAHLGRITRYCSPRATALICKNFFVCLFLFFIFFVKKKALRSATGYIYKW